MATLLNPLSNFQNWICVPDRATSREIDFGVNWTLKGEGRWPFWRLSWIETTGELYAVEMTADVSDPGRRFIVLGTILELESVERTLTNWADPVCSFYRNLTALYMRVQSTL